MAGIDFFMLQWQIQALEGATVGIDQPRPGAKGDDLRIGVEIGDLLLEAFARYSRSAGGR